MSRLATPGLYAPAEDGKLRWAANDGGDENEAPPLALTAVHAALRAFVQHEDYPCVGAKAALNNGKYRLGCYGALGSDEAARRAVGDLQWFARNAEQVDPEYATFLAVFDGPWTDDEGAFERQMWRQLQAMHELDAVDHPWDPAVSADPEDPDFGFSIGGAGFFIVGMHPGASRHARRFPYPMLVWNLHAQFERLRKAGRFERMKEVIRARDAALQGTPNPELADFGDQSQARQYSGRLHHPGWTAPFEPTGCPFHE